LGPQELEDDSKAGEDPDLSALEEFHRFSWLLSASENSRVAEMTAKVMLNHTMNVRKRSSADVGTGHRPTKKHSSKGHTNSSQGPDDSASKAMSYFA
jgi:hypothetical protein